VKHLPADELVVSNRPWALYYASGHQPVVPRPGPLVPAASLVPSTVRELLDAACSGPVDVAWYGKPGSDAVDDVFPGLTLRPVHSVRDGFLYELSESKPCRTGSSDLHRRVMNVRFPGPRDLDHRRRDVDRLG